MKIVDGEWTVSGNKIKIECDCGFVSWHPANRKIVRCPNYKCRKIINAWELKQVILHNAKEDS